MNKSTQKIVSFSEHKSDIEEVKKFLQEGWAVVKLIPNRGHFIGLLEKIVAIDENGEDIVYLPPRKKILVN